MATQDFEKSVLIVAGGSGSRMGSDIPKQFLPVAGVPVLIHTIRRFFDYQEDIRIVLVLPADQFMYWQKISPQYLSESQLEYITLSEGGSTRSVSVAKGLERLNNSSSNPSRTLVAIHDGVRPFINHQIIDEAYSLAANHGASVVCMPVKPSLREMTEDGGSRAVDRSRFFEVQTPQTFILKEILEVYRNIPGGQTFTDDASLFQSTGRQVVISQGSYNNIKITTPEDMFVAENILKTLQQKGQ